MTFCPEAIRAAELIEERGWSQFMYSRPDGSICMSAALDRAAGVGDLTGRVREIEDALRDVLGCYVYEFNDHPSRTKEQVIRALRSYGESGTVDVALPPAGEAGG